MVIHLFNCQFVCGYEWLFTYLIVSLCVGMNGYSLI